MSKSGLASKFLGRGGGCFLSLRPSLADTRPMLASFFNCFPDFLCFSFYGLLMFEFGPGLSATSFDFRVPWRDISRPFVVGFELRFCLLLRVARFRSIEL